MDVEETHGNSKYRGKLYALSEDSAWEDTGTGYASIANSTGDGHEGRRLVFRHEDTGEVLHDRPVFGSDTYQLQGEGERQTIIVWEDPESQKDWALSFQDPDGTAKIWEALSREDNVPDEKRLLPLPALASLGDLCRMLSCVPPSQREALAKECISARFLAALRETFHTAEDLNSEEALASLWHITKGIFLLSNQKLTERYLKDDVYDDVLGMLEYDAGLPMEKRIPHRQVMKVKVQFNHVVTFEDAETLERIHLNYRLQYLKDIVLPRLLDDSSFVSLTQMIHANISLILDHLQKSAQLLETLLLQVQQLDLQSLLFLQDACRLAKHIPPLERQAIYDKMVEHNLFEVLVPFFREASVAVGTGRESSGQSEPARPRHLVVEVLLLSTLNDPAHLRGFLTAESTSGDGRALLRGLIRVLQNEEDQGVQSQALEILKSVMDPTALEHRERDTCLDVFYDRGALDELVEPLHEPLQCAESSRSLAPASCFGRQLVCELLAFAVTHHGFRAKTYILRHGVMQQAMRLMAASQRFLQLAPVRLLRSIVGTKDDGYHRYVAKNGLFAPLLRSFQNSLQPPALGGNLLISVTLEVIEFIRVENIKILVDHLCKKHGDVLQAYAPRFKVVEGLLLKHLQNQECEAFPPEQHTAGGPIAPSGGVGGRSGRQRSPGREEDDDDEAYFESLDDEDDVAGQVAPQGTEALTPEQQEEANRRASEEAEASRRAAEERRARMIAAAGRAFGSGNEGGSALLLKSNEETSQTGGTPLLLKSNQAPTLKGLLGGYEDDESADAPGAAQDNNSERPTGEEAAGQDAAQLPTLEDSSQPATTPSSRDDTVNPPLGTSMTDGEPVTVQENPSPQPALAELPAHAGPAEGEAGTAEATTGLQELQPCGLAGTAEDAMASAQQQSSGNSTTVLQPDAAAEMPLQQMEERTPLTGSRAQSPPRQPSSEALGMPETKAAEEPDEAEAKGNTASENAANEKALNHVPKRLKTSASVES